MAVAKTRSKKATKKGSKAYAIIQSGGKQYRVTSGDTIDVERLDAEDGGTVELEQVLMVVEGSKISVGTPTVEGAKVIAEVMGNGKGEKVTVFKYKPKVRYRRMQGHRQMYTRLAIKDIVC